MARPECIDVCYEVLKMILVAGEKKHGLCETDTSGVNHEELLRRLENYKLVNAKSQAPSHQAGEPLKLRPFHS